MLAQSDLKRLKEEMERILRNEQPVDFQVVPGVWLGVYDGDSMYTMTFGDIQADGAVFELGSATKPIVAWLAEKALDSLGYDGTVPICTFLPDSLCSERIGRLNVNHLLTHRAGLGRLPKSIGRHESDVTDPYRFYTLDHFISDMQIETSVPGMYSYSHSGYALLNWIFEQVGGIATFLEKTLTDPLQMQHTGFNSDARMAEGHGMDGRPQPPWHTGAFRTAMGLHSDVHDLIKFIRFVSPSLVNHLPKMTKQLKKEMHKLSRAEVFKVEQGWFLVPSGKNLMYYHNGRTGGHHASIAFSPHQQKGVVILSNGSLGSGDLSISALRMLCNAKPQSKG